MRYFVFDLDDTLYPRGNGVMQEVRRLILSYMTERLQMQPEQANVLRHQYLTRYGTTMAGLLRHWHVDPDDYLSYVHPARVERFLQPNPELDRVLADIAHPKVIWTNATRLHAERVLDALGIGDHFSPIVDVCDMNYVSKPAPEVYPRFLSLVGAEGHECVLIEDSVRNLHPAKSLGMTTVLVGGESGDGVDYVIDTVEQIGELAKSLPGLQT
jgi:putative hydrolase of the HAD superfamily